MKIPKVINDSDLVRMKWEIDREIPIFKKDREYIDNIVYIK